MNNAESATAAIGNEPLKRLFYPRSIALVGASERSPWSQLLHANIQRVGFAGRVYAVNKTGAAAHGYPGFPSCVAIPEAVDAAYLLVPLEAALDALDDVIASGIKSAVILTSGFAEAGPEGARLQDQLTRRARAAGVTFLGPNCLGFANLSIGAAMTPMPFHPPFLPGKVALVSQSGATAIEIVEMAHDSNIGLSMCIATGNEAMLDTSACVDFLVDDEHVRVIMVFAETIRDTATFAAAARRALAQKKAIVILKAGATELTAKVAAAHTGSLVGDDAVFDAACRQLGVIRVHALEDLVVTAGLLAHTGPLKAAGVGIVSISGGACTLIADRAEAHGVSLPAFSPATQALLREAVPGTGEALNPFDITGVAVRDPALFERVLTALGDDPAIGFVGCVYSMPWNDKWDKVPAIVSIGRALGALGKPSAMLNQTSRPLTQKSRDIMAETGVPAVFGGIEAVVAALGRISLWSAWAAQGTAVRAAPAQASDARPDGERAVLDYLAARGVPVIPARLASTRDEALAHAAAFDAPVALKIASPDIAHKTDVGGVQLNLRGDAAVGAAFDAILESVRAALPAARLDGVLVSPMRGGGLEILVGTVRDPQWGQTLAVGLGGVWVEALADTQLRLLPVTAAEARGMLTGLRAAKLLQGFRGTPAADLDRLAEVIAAIGDAALALGDSLVTLEVNPLWVRGGDIEALDGLVIYSGSIS
ncbi:acetate--CoA ligase family protein [Pseudoduganella namucuonensis]|uniref:Acyl-CoA synthetase (NDP forming) n=1 Tax=Pseudoduganella namucuonensis TaxID=1035707 RepID=A0A1I7KS18_9BURK|nr:acetate--CoA ligase family protein [Pseudoduganella namucuonensis]SFV00239.1 Acyl-CoA synthetase (NDP forming) [Pseudoduganella namucuonensis]